MFYFQILNGNFPPWRRYSTTFINGRRGYYWCTLAQNINIRKYFYISYYELKFSSFNESLKLQLTQKLIFNSKFHNILTHSYCLYWWLFYQTKKQCENETIHTFYWWWFLSNKKTVWIHTIPCSPYLIQCFAQYFFAFFLLCLKIKS